MDIILNLTGLFFDIIDGIISCANISVKLLTCLRNELLKHLNINN